MNTPLVLLLIAYCSDALEFKTLDQNVGPVVYVNILYRHGERTIIKPYPNDPYKDPKYWPLGWGQLTKVGLYDHFVLGNWLGRRYKNLLPKNRNYNRLAIRVQSTDGDRTLMSAEANLAGMFPLTEEEKWGGPNWQPVPVHTIPQEIDKVLAAAAPCKRYDLERHNFEASDEYKAILKKYKPLATYVEKHSGLKMAKLDDFEFLHTTLHIERQIEGQPVVAITSRREHVNMNISLLVILLAAYCSDALEFKTLDQDVGPVVYVNALFRHGERTIIKPYPNDPYKDPKYWPLGWGQLTKAGIHHHFVLGDWLGRRYMHLLPTDRNYNRKAIRVQSTDVDRTLMSAEANLAGMFPLTEEEKWDGLNWQPVPVHTIPENLDKVLAAKAPCKRYDFERHNFEKSDEYMAMLKKYKTLATYLEKHSGSKMAKLDDFEYLHSTLLIEQVNNYTLPDWTKSVFPEKTREVAGLSFAEPTWTPEMKRLRGGLLVKDMLSNFKKKLDKTLDPPCQNISVYSAHDTTVASLLNTLGVFNFLPPPFASLVLLELRQSPSNEHTVTLLYKNSTDPLLEPHILNIPGCSSPCRLTDFESSVAPVVPEDWDSECHQHEFFDLTNDQPYNTLAIFGSS